MDSKQLRQLFFDFFNSREHEIVKSAPMVVKNDPTLMFTNAGMNQFKDIFLGHQSPSSRRVANSQKCLRVSGKHNDLEEVGHDTYHHTMFEMLGNWSFGDYFKNEAIEWSWQFLTDKLEIDPDRIYVTVFEGDKDDKTSRDNEAANVWEKFVSDPATRIINGSKKDNFWEMGDTGPCGPCSEIHVDLRDQNEREKIAGHELVNKDHPLVIEIWNLVFIQYNRKSDGTLENLPEKHIDTGMGFERLCMVTQGKKSNYDTDIFQDIIKEISSLTGIEYGDNEKKDIAMRVVADHLRAVAFSIADGQLPSNNKAGYVIRRILRRSIRYAYTFLGQSDPFIYRLIPSLIENMGEAFPELKAQEKQIARVILQEEKTFLHTLGKGIRLIEKKIGEMEKKGEKVFPGSDAFILYDTYGFPLDLTELILKENGYSSDTEGFQTEMDKQRKRSRADASKSTDDWVILDKSKSFRFTGYTKTEDKVKIKRYRRVLFKGKEIYHLVFDRSPFYAESGGQTGDTGTLSDGKETINIINTIKENNLHIHISKNLPSNTEAVFDALVDRKKRHFTTYNHSATHLLHYALRKVLGSHVEQKGSLVNHEKLRFDFSHFQKLTRDELEKIENIVNELIRKDIPSEITEHIDIDQALKRGALALFGEKYGKDVRVVAFGDSVELCGGTHVRSTANIGLFKIVSEEAVAAGIRRIEALTSSNAFDFLNSKLKLVDKISDILGISSGHPETIIKLQDENERFRRDFEKLQEEAASVLKSKLLARGEIIHNYLFIAEKVKVSSVEMLKSIARKINENNDNIIMVLGAEINGKANLLVMISKDITINTELDASIIIKEAAREIKGGGGGQPFLATAGGKDPEGLDRALEIVKNTVTGLL